MSKHSAFSQQEEQLSSLHQGTMTCFQLFDGIELSLNHYYSDQLSLQHDAFSHILEVNYCHLGVMGWNMDEQYSLYLSHGDVDIHMMNQCARSKINLPTHEYKGITLLYDLDILKNQLPWLEHIDILALKNKLNLHLGPLVLSSNQNISQIFSHMYDYPQEYRLSYYRLKALEFLLYLTQIDPYQEEQVESYRLEYVQLIQEIHQFLIQNIEHRYTIAYLSKKFLLNTSTLKKVFKAVYGKPIATYMKEYRMEKAKLALEYTNDSISTIASQVGYESQGKFTEAFRQYTQMLPKEYKKKYGK